MKITFVMSDVNMSGGVRVVAIYAERLYRRGHDVSVVACPPKPATQQQQLQSVLRGKGLIPTLKSYPSHFDKLDLPLRFINRWRPIETKDLPDADVVIATWWETAHWVNKLSAAKGAKAYFIQHHEVFDYLPKNKVKATYKMPLHKVTISKWLVDLMDKEYGDRHVSLVPNSVDTKQFFAPPRQKQPVPTVGLLYSPIAWKGCAVSFKALSIVAQKIPNLRILTFGEVPPTPDLPLPDNAEFFLCPAQDSIKDIYAQCDVWLCGSYSEGFHLPPSEAMACRCPIVSTRVGGPLDIIEDGVNGYLVPVGDAEALADRLMRVLSLDAEQWLKLSNAAYDTAVNYTWDDATNLFEAALATAIERRAKGDF